MPEAPAPPARVRMAAHVHVPLTEGWEAAACAPDAYADPAAAGAATELTWLPARVPGTAAGALAEAGAWALGEPAPDLDAQDWWFRTRFTAPPPAPGEQVVLALDGIATVAEVFLDGERVLESDSMFAAHALDVGALLRGEGEHELAIRCRALAPLLTVRRRPRARWRTKLVNGNLRWFRTMLLGRAPGFAPGPAAVGPWRPVRLERRRTIAVEQAAIAPRLDGETGVLGVIVALRALDGATLERAAVELSGPSGTHRAALALAPAAGADGAVEASGELRVPDVARWWPHTHGDPVLHDVRITVAVAGRDGSIEVALGRVGFRTLAPGPAPGHDVERDGLDLHVNGVRVFARGALWTPPDFVTLAPDAPALRAALERVRDGGMNMLRIPGTAAYESPAFHDLCDELGILVWQDAMFANLDYPIAEPAFRTTVEREVQALLDQLAGRPSFAVLCGNSEIEQQVAMLGLDPALGRGELFGELLPGALAAAGADAVYVPSAPSGGERPFRNDRGVAHYFGVGGYRRPLEDARRAEVRFAAECLAFANVPDDAGVAAVLPGGPAGVGHDPAWKRGVPRDSGTGWDFEDVRDHYLALLYGLDPAELRRVDPERYLALSRAVSGEAIAETIGEWRRAGSPCGGALVLWLQDLVPGAGWGLVDHAGEPKAAYHHLRRACAPIAVWTTDEGMNGVAVHVANDRPEPLRALLRIALYRDGEQRVAEASAPLALAPHTTVEHDAEALLGRFADVSYAYRFGPPAHDVVVASLERASADDAEPLAQAFRFPAGRPLTVEPADRIGLSARLSERSGDAPALVVRARRVAYGVRVHAAGFDAEDDAFSVEPGVARVVRLRPRAAGTTFAGAALSALNVRGRVPVATEPEDG